MQDWQKQMWSNILTSIIKWPAKGFKTANIAFISFYRFLTAFTAENNKMIYVLYIYMLIYFSVQCSFLAYGSRKTLPQPKTHAIQPYHLYSIYQTGADYDHTVS